MKNGSELVWSMWEWESRIEWTSTCCSTERTCDSDPASRAIDPLINRQVIRQSRLSPPYPPSTWRRIDGLKLYPRNRNATRKPQKQGARPRPDAVWNGYGESLEAGADPEVGAVAAQLLLQIPLPGEVPVDVQPQELGGDPPAVGGDAVLQPLGVAVVVLETLEAVEVGPAGIEEDHPPDAPEAQDRGGEHVDQGEADLGVGEEGPVADHGGVVEGAQGVQAAEEEGIGGLAAARPQEDAEGEVAALGERHVLPEVQAHGGELAAAPLGRGRETPLETPAPAGDGTPFGEARRVAHDRRLEQGEVVVDRHDHRHRVAVLVEDELLEVDLADDVAQPDLGAVVEGEGIDERGERPGLLEGGPAAGQKAGRVLGDVEGAVVEALDLPLLPLRQVGIGEVEVREALDRREVGEDAAVAQVVGEAEQDPAEDGLVALHPGVGLGVLQEELAAAVLLLVAVVDRHLDVRLVARQLLGRRRRGRRLLRRRLADRLVGVGDVEVEVALPV